MPIRLINLMFLNKLGIFQSKVLNLQSKRKQKRMKSIKEKAEEYDRIVERISPNQSIVDMSGRKQFEAGANYVLEQLEEFLNLYGVYCMNSSAKVYLKDMIEQLKK